MLDDNYNITAINDVYKNAHIALQSISDLLPSVDDDELKAELQIQYDDYEKIIGKISKYMSENNLEPKDISPVKKAFMAGSIKMKTMINNSRNQIAEMMIKGTVMGINELTAMKNEGQNLNEKVLLFVEKLLKLEEENIEKLKAFL